MPQPSQHPYRRAALWTAVFTAVIAAADWTVATQLFNVRGNLSPLLKFSYLALYVITWPGFWVSLLLRIPILRGSVGTFVFFGSIFTFNWLFYFGLVSLCICVRKLFVRT